MTPDQVGTLAWSKGAGLLPAIVQHARTGQVLMLAFMNQEALSQTLSTGRAVFFSRSRAQLWTKGETSGHYLNVVDVSVDCDADSILVLADPLGPTCHNGTESCFASAASTDAAVALVPARARDNDRQSHGREARGQLHRAAGGRGSRSYRAEESARKAWRPRLRR